MDSDRRRQPSRGTWRHGVACTLGRIVMRSGELGMLTRSHSCFVQQAGSTALIWASKEGHVEVIKALLAAGADKYAKDEVADGVGV